MTKKPDMREVALDTLLDMERNGKLSHIAMGETLMRNQFIPKQDRAFYSRLCEGVTERRIYLDYILNHYSKTPMKKCKPLIRTLLRMSAYQILFMNVPDSAACNEAVSLAKKRGFRNLSGFVNGVLRTIARQKEKLPMPDEKKESVLYDSVKYSMPEFIVELLRKQYGIETTKNILEAFLKSKKITIRANGTGKDPVTPEELKAELMEEDVDIKQGQYFPYAFEIEGYNYLGKLRSFKKGHFVVQDESSMFPVSVAGIEKGSLVLDVCAAPGGKTFHAAQCTGNEGTVIARDVSDYKTDLIEENKERLNIEQVKVEKWDATVLDESMIGKADVVLADLPCSGLGIMGKKNDIKYHIGPQQMSELVTLQRQILSVVWQYVKPGGELIFSTCTLNHKENEENVQWIRENTPLESASIEERLPKELQQRTGEEGYLQLIPGKDACDGFFFSRFIRKER